MSRQQTDAIRNKPHRERSLHVDSVMKSGIEFIATFLGFNSLFVPFLGGFKRGLGLKEAFSCKEFPS